MTCLDILINGKRVCVAGVPRENRVAADIYISPDSDIPQIFVCGDAYNADHSWKQRLIFGQQQLQAGDEVLIRAVEDGIPDQPIETHEINFTKESEELTNRIVETTAKLWLERLLSGKPIPTPGQEGEKTKELDQPQGHYCSFCGKKNDEVEKLIAGPSVYICNECIVVCVELLEGKQDQKQDEKPSAPIKARWPSHDESKEV